MKVNLCVEAQAIHPIDGDRVEYLTAALLALMAALSDHRTEMAKHRLNSPEPEPMRIYTLDDLERYPNGISEDPVDWTLKRGLRTVGKELNQIGGEDLMFKACGAVEVQFGVGGSAVIDKVFDGIGSWVA